MLKLKGLHNQNKEKLGLVDATDSKDTNTKWIMMEDDYNRFKRQRV